MKKLFAMSAVLMMFVTTGCGALTTAWDGVSHNQKEKWTSIGVNPGDAKIFRANGFTMVDVKPWKQMGVHDPQTVIKAYRAGLTPREARANMNVEVSVREYIPGVEDAQAQDTDGMLANN